MKINPMNTRSRVQFFKLASLLWVLTLPTLAHADALDIWHWRNPLPPGNFFTAIGFGGGTFLAIHDIGTAWTSTDGIDWIAGGFVGSSGGLNAIAYGNGTFVAVGASGMIISSQDTLRWTARASPTTASLTSVAYGNGTFVAVGADGTILSSPDGVTWTLRHSEPVLRFSFYSVSFGGGVFLTVGNYNRAFAPADGINWAAQQIDGSFFGFTGGNLVGYGDGTFLVVGTAPSGGGGGIVPALWRSTNALQWTRVSSFIPGSWALVFGAGTFLDLGVVANPIGCATSTDGGVTWVPHSLPVGVSFRAATYGNGAFVGIGSGATGILGAMRSTNGVDWTPTFTFNGDRSFGVGAATYGAGKYVLVGSTVITSSNALTFTRVDGVASNLTAVVYANGKFVSVGAGGICFRSEDGNAWVRGHSGTLKSLAAVAYGNGKFVAVGDSGTIRFSDDGLFWTGASSGTDYSLWAIVYAQNRFVAVGQLGIILVSTNGLDWTAHYTDDFETLTSIAYGGFGQFVAVGGNGAIQTSSDALSWSKQNLGTNSTLRTITYGGGLFVTAGNGVLFSSPDGVHWERRFPPTTASPPGVIFLNDTFLLFGGSTILQSDPVGMALFLARKSMDNFEFAVGGIDIGQTFRVQTCTDLRTRSWTDVGTFTQTQTLTRIVVPAGATVPHCFYRAVAP